MFLPKFSDAAVKINLQLFILSSLNSFLSDLLLPSTPTLNHNWFDAIFLFLQMNRLESEFSSYKVRAHALLQKKEADLAAAVDSDQIRALEEALKVNASKCNVNNHVDF